MITMKDGLFNVNSLQEAAYLPKRLLLVALGSQCKGINTRFRPDKVFLFGRRRSIPLWGTIHYTQEIN